MIVYIMVIVGMMLVKAVPARQTANIQNSETQSGSGRLRSNQILQTAHGMCISAMVMCSTSTRATSAMSGVCANVTDDGNE